MSQALYRMRDRATAAAPEMAMVQAGAKRKTKTAPVLSPQERLKQLHAEIAATEAEQARLAQSKEDKILEPLLGRCFVYRWVSGRRPLQQHTTQLSRLLDSIEQKIWNKPTTRS